MCLLHTIDLLCIYVAESVTEWIKMDIHLQITKNYRVLGEFVCYRHSVCVNAKTILRSVDTLYDVEAIVAGFVYIQHLLGFFLSIFLQVP